MEKLGKNARQAADMRATPGQLAGVRAAPNDCSGPAAGHRRALSRPLVRARAPSRYERPGCRFSVPEFGRLWGLLSESIPYPHWQLLEVVRVRVLGGCGSVAGPGFGEDPVDVAFDGVVAEDEGVCDFGV